MMSLGTWTRRSTKYQKFLNLSNVFLLIASTALLFTSVVLMRYFHMTKLSFWSWYFYALPMCMLVLGLYTFAVSVYGFLISDRESKGLISLIAVFLSIAFLGQIFSVWTAIELRNIIELDLLQPGPVKDSMELFGEDESVTAEWDSMQTELRCCGGMNYETGYQTWGNVRYSQTPGDRSGRNSKDVPDSCCHSVTEGCGKDKLEDDSFSRWDLGIWKDGCVEILRYKMKTEVKPILLGYTFLGALLAIVELITVVLACAYVAQINRRDKRQRHTNDRMGNAHAEDEYLPALASKETNF